MLLYEEEGTNLCFLLISTVNSSDIDFLSLPISIFVYTFERLIVSLHVNDIQAQNIAFSLE
jgi:hypothetical protein